MFNPGGRFPAGRYLAVNVGNEFVEIYDMDTLTLLTSLDFGDDFTFGMSFDPEGKWLAGGTADGHAWVLDLAAVVAGTAAADAMLFDETVHAGRERRPCPQRRRPPGHGRAERRTGQAVGRLVERPADRAPDRAIRLVAPGRVQPDGSYLLYNDGGVLRRYPLDPDELIELAESRLTRGLTPEECRQYLSAGRCDEES